MTNAKSVFERLAALNGILIYESDKSKLSELTWFKYEYICYDVYGFGHCKLEEEQLVFEFNYEIKRSNIEFNIKGGVDRGGDYFITHFNFYASSSSKASFIINTASLLSFDITAITPNPFPKNRKYWYFRCQANQIFPELIQS